MLLILWEYEVLPERRAAFVQAYGPDGAWAELFSRADGFLGLELLCDQDGQGRFLTIDRWRSREAFEGFMASSGEPYRALGDQLHPLSVVQTRLGAFREPD